MPRQCRLLAGPPAFAAQAVLAIIALLGLILKRQKEVPQRPIKVWGMDVSKQVVSTAAAHLAGMSIAIVLASTRVSECAWYFVAFSFDTTLGVAIALGLHTCAVRSARKMCSREPPNAVLLSIAECGHYGEPPSLSRLWPQLVEFTSAVLTARFCCGLLIFLLREALVHMAHVLDDLFQDRPTHLLFFVVIACPLTMNLLQALIQDHVLKRRRADTPPSEMDVAHRSSDNDQMHLISHHSISPCSGEDASKHVC